MTYDLKAVQAALNGKGFGPLVVDGKAGPKTSAAIIAFKKSVGYKATDYVGPLTYEKLVGGAVAEAKTDHGPPWYLELLRMIGKHEKRNHKEVAEWLKSDGGTVGDPASVPWCGDAVATALRLAIPNIGIPSNPYLASNWTTWGKEVEPQLGAILVFWRGSPDSWQGHIGFYAGESATNYYVLGGNQSDSVTISPIAKNRLRKGGSRWPILGAPAPSGTKVQMSGGTVSTNEA